MQPESDPTATSDQTSTSDPTPLVAPVDSMRPSLRHVRRFVLGALLVATGALSVPALSAAGTDREQVNLTSISTGANSIFVPISAFRAYDSRGSFDGKLSAHHGFDPGRNPRPIWALGDDSGQLIPSDAVAVSYAVTIARTEGSGYIEIDGFFNADGEQSTIVWNGPGQRLSSSGIAMLTSAFDDAGFLGAFVGSPGARTDVIIDITGYFVALP